MVNPCGLIRLTCSRDDCDVVFEILGPTPEDLAEPLCPQCQRTLECEGLDDYYEPYPLSRGD